MATLTTKQNPDTKLWEVYNDGQRVSSGTQDIAEKIVSGQSPLPPLPTKEPSMFSSTAGADALNAAKKKADALAGVPTTPATQPTPNATQPTPEAPKKDASKTVFTNVATGQEYTFNSDDLNNQANIDFIKKNNLDFVEGNVPSWLTQGDTDSSTTDFNAAKAELQTAKTALQNLNVSNDPTLQRMLGNISTQWDSRIADMERANKSRVAAFGQAGIRMGSRYAQGIFDTIVGAEEKDGMARVATLQSQKDQALLEAQNAYQNQEWTKYSKLVDVAQKSYDNQLSTINELNKATITANAKIKERADQSERDTVITKLYSSGLTDPAQIIKSANELGYKLTSKDVKDSLDVLVPPWMDELVKSVSANGGASLLPQIFAAKDRATAYTISEPYLQTASGDLGEALAIKRELLSKGIVPPSTEDLLVRVANQKAKANNAGIANALYSSAQETAIRRINDSISKNQTYSKTTNMRTAVDNTITALSQETGVSDIAAINQFQKVIDEGAVTRDQDVVLIQGAQSLANSLKTKIKQLEKGDKLSPTQRAEMKTLVNSLFESQLKALQKDPYISAKTKEAERAGVNVDDTILGEIENIALSGLGDEIAQDETTAKNAVNTFLTSFPQYKDQAKNLYLKNFTESQVYEYFKGKGVIK